MSDIIQKIIDERIQQDSKWGEQNHSNLYWIGILTEEVGEVAKAVIEFNHPELYKELIQLD